VAEFAFLVVSGHQNLLFSGFGLSEFAFLVVFSGSVVSEFTFLVVFWVEFTFLVVSFHFFADFDPSLVQ
jgi:hypothetical protein